MRHAASPLSRVWNPREDSTHRSPRGATGVNEGVQEVEGAQCGRAREARGGVAQEQWRCLPHEDAQPSSAPRRWRSGVTAASRAAAVAGVPGPAAGAHLPQSSCGSSGGRFVSTPCLPWCMERRPAQVQPRIRMMYALRKVCRPTNLNRLSEPSRCYLPPCLVICRPVWLSAAVSGFLPPCLVICRAL